MPAMGTTGQPPNFNGNFSTPMRGSEEGIPINVHDGRGWEPKRTFVGSNERTYASVRSISGRNRRERTGEYDRREMPREFSASAAEWAASRPIARRGRRGRTRRSRAFTTRACARITFTTIPIYPRRRAWARATRTSALTCGARSPRLAERPAGSA